VRNHRDYRQAFEWQLRWRCWNSLPAASPPPVREIQIWSKAAHDWDNSDGLLFVKEQWSFCDLALLRLCTCIACTTPVKTHRRVTFWMLFQRRKVPLIKVSWLIWSRSSVKESYTASSHLFRFLVFAILHSVVNVTDSVLQRICGAQIQGNEGYQRMIFYLFRSHQSEKSGRTSERKHTSWTIARFKV
jgi:hypothetical protein